VARVYSHRFFAQQSTSEVALYYEVPAGQLAVLRCIDWVAQISGSTVASAGLVEQSSAAFVDYQNFPPLGSIEAGTYKGTWRGRQVFYEGETMIVYLVTGGDTLGVFASGYLLDLP
jgi:hypothetical protein